VKHTLRLYLDTSVVSALFDPRNSERQKLTEDYHIAVASINRIEYVVSWNFRHIVRKKTKDIVTIVNSMKGLTHTEIFSPGELL